jgi:hypothetical protein
MSYATVWAAVNDATFQGRCKVAVWIAAGNILTEDPQTPNHAARLNWARTAQADRLAITPQNLAQAVLQNATIAANPTAASDGDIQFQVNSVVDWLISVG